MKDLALNHTKFISDSITMKKLTIHLEDQTVSKLSNMSYLRHRSIESFIEAICHKIASGKTIFSINCVGDEVKSYLNNKENE